MAYVRAYKIGFVLIHDMKNWGHIIVTQG